MYVIAISKRPHRGFLPCELISKDKEMAEFRSRSVAAALAASLALLLLSSSAISGERSARFRSGTILSAEISTNKPDICDESPYELYKALPDLAWAEIVFKLDKGRSLSSSDYVLVAEGVEYKCLAIAEDDRVYSVRDWVFDKTNMFGYYRMVFPIQMPPAGKPLDFDLRFKLFSSPMTDVPVRFRNMGALPFTEVSKIPLDGILGLSLADLRPKRAAAAAPAPAAAPAGDQKPAEAKKEEPKKDDAKK